MASNKVPPAIWIKSQTDKSGTVTRYAFKRDTRYERAGGLIMLVSTCISPVFAGAAKENFTLRRPRTDYAKLLAAGAGHQHPSGRQPDPAPHPREARCGGVMAAPPYILEPSPSGRGQGEGSIGVQ
jgi:hypothetical protein